MSDDEVQYIKRARHIHFGENQVRFPRFISILISALIL